MRFHCIAPLGLAGVWGTLFRGLTPPAIVLRPFGPVGNRGLGLMLIFGVVWDMVCL